MSRSTIALAFLLTVAGSCLPAGAHAALACSAYRANVHFEGVLSRATFPEQPNFESIAAGDRPTSYFFVTPASPLCVDANPDGHDPAEFTDRLQLVFAEGPATFSALRPALAHTVVCDGRLMHGMSGHHHTPILLIDARCEPR